jgi:hypothetical protein
MVSESGTGLTTGASYDLRASFHESFESPSVPAPNFIATFSETGRVTSPTSGLSFTSRFFIHVVGLPSGEVTVTKIIDTSGSPECS